MIALFPSQQFRRIVLVAAGKGCIFLRQGLDGVLHAGDAASIAQLHAEIRCEPVTGRSGCESPGAVELVGVVFHPLHQWVLSGLVVPAAFVDEDGLGWVRHLAVD